MVSEDHLFGVLGGTFDPVHLGHLSIAREVQRTFSLSRLLLMLSALPPHKERASLSSTADREAMLRLAVSGESRLEVSTLELERREISYTIDSLRSMRDGRPGGRPVFILGMDSLFDLPTWKDYLELMAEWY